MLMMMVTNASLVLVIAVLSGHQAHREGDRAHPDGHHSEHDADSGHEGHDADDGDNGDEGDANNGDGEDDEDAHPSR